MTAPSSAALTICHAAIAIGPLTRDGSHYRFGRRRFNAETVNAVRASGVHVTIKPRKPGSRRSPAKNRLRDILVTPTTQAAVKEIAEQDGISQAEAVRRLIVSGLVQRRETESEE